MAIGTIDGRAAVRPLRQILGAFLVLHGIAHLVGTTASLKAVDESTSVSYLAGGLTISDPTALRALAAVWAVAGALVLVSGLLTFVGRHAWRTAVLGAITLSLVLSTFALTAAVVGVIIDVLLLVGLLVADRAGLDREPKGLRR
jgi:hypothetical protein